MLAQEKIFLANVLWLLENIKSAKAIAILALRNRIQEIEEILEEQ
jgi:hypothetical protein